MIDRGPDRPAAVLEHEHVLDVVTCPERSGARRPQLHHPGRLFLTQDREGSSVLRAVQDDLVAPAGQGRPAVREMPDVKGLGGLEPARAERAQPIGTIRTLLPPWGDHHVSARQRIDPQVSVAHGASPYAGGAEYAE